MALVAKIPELTPNELQELAVLYAEEGDMRMLEEIAGECEQLEFNWMNHVGGWDETSLAYGSLSLRCRNEIERRSSNGKGS